MDELEDVEDDDYDDRPVGGPPCPDYPPGDADKIAVMRWRLLRGYALFHPGDAPIGHVRIVAGQNTVQPGPLERTFQDPGFTGIERTKDGKRWRVRPFWNGVKHSVGVYMRLEDAKRAARRFWTAQLGLFAEHRGEVKHWGKPEKKKRTRRPPRQTAWEPVYADLFGELPAPSTDSDSNTRPEAAGES